MERPPQPEGCQIIDLEEVRRQRDFRNFMALVDAAPEPTPEALANVDAFLETEAWFERLKAEQEDAQRP